VGWCLPVDFSVEKFHPGERGKKDGKKFFAPVIVFIVTTCLIAGTILFCVVISTACIIP